MNDIKNVMNDAIYAFKNVEIAKHYDCSTSFRDKKSEKSGFDIAFKGDFSITPMQILTVGVATVIMCVALSVKKKCCKK